jgi:glycosyltransferase involved in cell wall biosynthesis
MKINEPLVSVIIRTCNRPKTLKNALISVRNQTYSNIEIVVVEDGKNTSEKMIKEEYSDINIRYFFYGDKVGRTKTGNYALKQAKGKYFNFLDDDDTFYPNHIELLVKALEKENVKAAYSVAQESQITIKSLDPYVVKEKRKLIRFEQPFNRILLCFSNYIPIQSIMFDRSLFDELGGFDEELELLEDWDLWVRYSTRTDFIFVNAVTSVYHVNYTRKEKTKRDIEFHKAQKRLKDKFKKYKFEMNVANVYDELDYVIKEYKTSWIKRNIRLIIGFVFYGER